MQMADKISLILLSLPLVWERVWKRYIPYPVVVKVSTSWDRNSGLPGTIMAWNKAQFETLAKRLDGVDWHMEESVKGREEYAIHFVAVWNHVPSNCPSIQS